MKTTKRPRRGSALALSLVMVTLVAGMGAAIASLSLSQNKVSAESNKTVALSYAAEAAIEKALLFVNTSDYDLNGNKWLNGFSPENSLVPPSRVPAPRYPAAADVAVFTDYIGDPLVADSVPNAKIKVDLFVYSIDDMRQKFRLMARAAQFNDTLILVQDVRAWDTFARFATFADTETLRFGTTTVKGHVHSNRGIEFFYGGAEFTQEVTAVEGFRYVDGATSTSTHLAVPNPNAPAIPMPSLGEMSALRTASAGMLDVTGNNFQYGNPGEIIDAQVEFNGDQVTIKGTNRTTGITVAGTYTIPPDGVIFVQGNVTSVKGTLSTRATLASMGDIRITDNIRYVDQNGQAAYQLTQNGTPVVLNQTDPGTAWTPQNGFDYVKNPAFQPPTNQHPTLGLMAANRIDIAAEAPRNVEVHASLFSLNDSWQADMSTAKENIRIVGSIASKNAGARAQGAMGYSLSGGYIYDDDLRQNPPPGWLKVQTPFPGQRWKSN